METSTDPVINKTIIIQALPAKVWEAITQPALMQQWMTETPIEIITSWEVGEPITIQGDWYHSRFENKGVVLQYEPERVLEYSHLSSLSRLADQVENYSVIKFALAPLEDGTELTLTLSNFPTDVIYKHLAFYWNVTLVLLKKFVEQ
ncbi:Uncharacterized conserved protein YndB, AHSA1/START domain [Chitinophaga rupis]|uniref:Uncharacterized conserved protein YndB, AHSA1/START domain n=1 Tax=Chitinophaga rupis TaxID=573321 RepID=A0A1H8IS11_9BACT|nr:SRPBCC domain-containing protein [Chitinophaga rupis]SEN70776.1 Uncharacterized conserved protein YndB, AHSA1/START domain [Chitinophaga rupis]